MKPIVISLFAVLFSISGYAQRTLSIAARADELVNPLISWRTNLLNLVATRSTSARTLYLIDIARKRSGPKPIRVAGCRDGVVTKFHKIQIGFTSQTGSLIIARRRTTNQLQLDRKYGRNLQRDWTKSGQKP